MGLQQRILSSFNRRSIGRLALRASDFLIHPSLRKQDLLATYRIRTAVIGLSLGFCLPALAFLTRFLSGAEMQDLLHLALVMTTFTIILGSIRWLRFPPQAILTIFFLILEIIRFTMAISVFHGTGSADHIHFPIGILSAFLMLDRPRALALSTVAVILHSVARWLEQQRVGQVWTLDPAVWQREAILLSILVPGVTVVCLYCYEFFYKLTMARYQDEQDRNLFLQKMDDLSDLAFNFYMQSKPYMLELRRLQEEASQQISQRGGPEQAEQTVAKMAEKSRQLAQISRSFALFSHSAFDVDFSTVDLKEVLQHVETILGISLAEYESSLSVHLPDDLHLLHARQSQLVMLISLVIQHEIKSKGCEINMTAENAGDDRVSLNIISKVPSRVHDDDKSDHLLLEAFRSLIHDLCKQTSCEAVMKAIPEGMSYCLMARTLPCPP